jgi:hypothetical protein
VDELRRPERDHAGDLGVSASERFGEAERALQRRAQPPGGVAEAGVERGGQTLQERQLPSHAVRPLGERAHDGESLVVQPDRLVVGERPGGHLGRLLVVVHRLLALAAAGVLLGQLRRGRVRVVGLQPFERLGTPAAG